MIVMTGHGDVPIAVEALKAGAMDFLEKPLLDDVQLLSVVSSALAASEQTREKAIVMAGIVERLASLTPVNAKSWTTLSPVSRTR